MKKIMSTKKSVQQVVIGLFFTYGIILACTLSAAAQRAHSFDGLVDIQIKEVALVQQYGWDNLEVTYQLSNHSEQDLKKVDFRIILLDAFDQKAGFIDVHDFEVAKNSTATYTYEDINTEFAHVKFEEFSVLEPSIAIKD